MQIDTARDDRLVVLDGDHALAEYVYDPTDAQRESPRPYLLLRTRDGADATAYRPADHVWHKGLSLALPNVGPHNFWGGPTYVEGEGYVQLPNNGSQVHRGFTRIETVPLDTTAGIMRIDERLDWISENGADVLDEHRSLSVRSIDERSWALTWRSALRNVTQDPLAFGSPTTKGRPDAGYAGIFWRGSADFEGGAILSAAGVAGEDARGSTGPWLALASAERDAGALMLDAGDGAPGNPWFARSEDYAGLCPAPFFFAETVLPPGGELVLAAAVVVGHADVADHASTIGAELVAELRAAETPEPTESEESV